MIEWNRLVPELLVNDYDRAKQFYGDILGFSLCFERPEDRFGYFDLGGAQIMLLERDQASAALPAITDARIHFQIEVEQLESLIRRLAEAEQALHKAPYTARYRGENSIYVQREFFVRDLDGYLLRFFQHLAEEPLPSV